MLGPAPAPEADRGDAIAGGVARAARRDHRAAAMLAASVGYTNVGHHGVPARRGRPFLLPRDEHAAAGRAPDHRDGDGRRPGAVADPARPRRAADARPRDAAAAARARHRVPHASRGSGRRLPAVAGTHRGVRSPAWPGHSRRQRRRGRSRDPDLLRPADLQARLPGAPIGRRPSRGCGGRCRNTPSVGVGPLSRSSGGCLPNRRLPTPRAHRLNWTSSCSSGTASPSPRTIRPSRRSVWWPRLWAWRCGRTARLRSRRPGRAWAGARGCGGEISIRGRRARPRRRRRADRGALDCVAWGAPLVGADAPERPGLVVVAPRRGDR